MASVTSDAVMKSPAQNSNTDRAAIEPATPSVGATSAPTPSPAAAPAPAAGPKQAAPGGVPAGGPAARVAAGAAPSARPAFPGKPQRPAPQQSPAHRSNTAGSSLPNKKQKGCPPNPQPDSHIDSRVWRVEVTGFPPHTRPQDLFRSFMCYGKVKVEKVYKKFALVAFNSKREAKFAVQDSQRISVYGQYVTVKYLGNVKDQDRRGNKNEFNQTKQKARGVVPPAALALRGPPHAQLDALLAAVRLTQDEVAALGALYADLERVLQPTWPGCQALPFGSITTGLGVKSSDADCFMNIPPQFRHPNVSFVNKAKRILQQYPQIFADLIAIPRANTPIVKFFHVPTGTHCDLTFKTPLGALNSKLIAFLLHADPRFIPMAVVIKYWAKVHGFSGTGKLTNYALTMLIVFYLQQPPARLLPAVQWLQRERSVEVIVDNWNTGFLHDYDRLPRNPAAPAATICDLLRGFFAFYAEFDFEKLVVCPFLGRAVERAAFREGGALPAELQLYRRNVAGELVPPLKVSSPLCVQDPFEQSHNVASTVPPRLAEDVREHFRLAAAAEAGEGFLRALLAERARAARARGPPEYRLQLQPRVLRALAAGARWPGALRAALLDLFARMLRAPLARLDDAERAPAADPDKERHRFLARLRNPVWSRDRVADLCDATALSFVDRESRITDEIIATAESETPLAFHLILSIHISSLKVRILLKHLEGDKDDFRNFAKFFLNTAHEWFIKLIHERNKLSAPPAVQEGNDTPSETTEGKIDVANGSHDSEEPSTDRTEECSKSLELSEAEDIAEETPTAPDTGR